jgi:F0F1-type ATP synthase assembly protein I
MSLILIGWLFTCGVLLHNTEEALYLPAWSADAGKWYKPVAAPQFRLAALILSAVFIGITTAASLSAAGGAAAYVMAGYVLAMVVNAFVPHVFATVLMRRYMPGTATALLLNLPLGIIYLRAALQQRHIAWHTFCWAGPLVAAVIAGLLLPLFAISRRLLSKSM